MDDYLYIEADEDITSVVEKLKRSEGKRIGLVAPRGSAILQSVVNLKLVLREAKAQDKDIALVTRDEVGRNLAHQVGLPVYDEVGQETPTPSPPPPQPREKEEIIQIREKVEGQARAPREVKIHEYWDGRRDKRTEEPTKGLPPEKFEVSSTDKMTGEPLPETSVNDKRSRGKLIFALVIIGLVAILTLAGLAWFLPRADINIKIPSETVTKSATITVSADQAAADINNRIIPGGKITQKIESTKNFPATGKKNVGEKAKGQVRISNSTGVAVEIAKGSILSDGAGRYLVTSGASVPAAASSIDSSGNVSVKPGEGTVSIEAETSGEAGNRSSGATFSITTSAGEVKVKVIGTADQGLTGGSDREVAIISQADLDKAKLAVQDDVRSQAEGKIRAKAGGKYFIKDSMQLNGDEAKAPKVGDEKENFDFTLKADVTALVYDEALFREAVTTVIEQGLPPDRGLLVSPEDKIELSIISADLEAGKLTIEGKLSSRVGPKIDPGELVAKIRGKTRTKALKILTQYPDIQSVEIFIYRGLGFVPLREESIILHWQY